MEKGDSLWVDMHTHVFNANYVPVEGIASSISPLARLAIDLSGLKNRIDNDDALKKCSDLGPVPPCPPDLSVMFPGGFMNWVELMLRRERDVYQVLRCTYKDIDLFVHHMMDLENHYHGRPKYDFVKDQIPRMACLVKWSGGKLLTFVAFDPYRSDGVDIVRNALSKRCCGVKYYPPNGFKPWGNRDTDLPRMVKASDVNRRNRELFTYCEDEQIPIFTHCQLGSLEAKTGYIEFADPKYWAKVLKQHPHLRLCFGHAGGGAVWAHQNAKKPEWRGQNTRFTERGGWFSNFPKPKKNYHWEGSWAKAVYELCVAYENVYCECGILHEVSESGIADNMAKRLIDAINKSSASAVYDFSGKFMYGSDWHMLHKQADYESYLQHYVDLFSNHPGLKPHWRKFMGDNAKKFLDIKGYLERHEKLSAGDRLTHAEIDHLQKFVS